MAESKYSTPARRMGAKAAVAALVKLETDIKQSPGGGFHSIDPTEAARILIEGAGEKLSPKMEGYLAALGEYLAMAYEGVLAAPAAFRPLAGMTDKQSADLRAAWAAYMAADDNRTQDECSELIAMLQQGVSGSAANGAAG